MKYRITLVPGQAGQAGTSNSVAASAGARQGRPHWATTGGTGVSGLFYRVHQLTLLSTHSSPFRHICPKCEVENKKYLNSICSSAQPSSQRGSGRASQSGCVIISHDPTDSGLIQIFCLSDLISCQSLIFYD